MVVSRAKILAVNNGNVRLVENKSQSKLYVKPLGAPFPTGQTATFDANPYFARAKREAKPYVAFQSLSGNSVLVVPTKPFANIKVFAEQALPQEWTELWKCVYNIRHQLQIKYGGHFYIRTIGVDVPQLHIRIERRPDVTYKLGFSPNVAPVDQTLIVKYANEPNGWTQRYNCQIKKTTSITSCDVVVQFATPNELEQMFGPDFKQLSVSQIHKHQTPHIYFNLQNWNRVPKNFRGSLSLYRKYLVQHELGHALFHVWNHDEEPSHGTCPVMMQQTRGTSTCVPGIDHHPHVWKLEKTKQVDEWLYSLC